jgi:hypothetical protein
MTTIKFSKSIGICCVLTILTPFFSSVLGQILISDNSSDTLNPSAQFQVKSSNKGFLPPVMSSNSRKAILNPAEGLMVYDTSKQRMYVFTNEGWKPLLFGIDTVQFGSPYKPTVQDLSIGDNLGVSTAIGNEFAIAGAYADDVDGKADQGSVYVYKRQGSNWQFYTKITAFDGQAGDYFGAAVALVDEFIFVGASTNNSLENIDEGAVYIYKIIDGSIQFQQKIRGNGATSGDRFGYSIAANKNELVIGSPFDDISGKSDQGSIYFFGLTEAGQWVQYQKYFLPTGEAIDKFGHGLSLDSNQLSVGNEIVTSQVNYGYSQNAVNILTKIDGVWTHEAKINQPDGVDKREGFGYATNIKGDILVVGAWLHDAPSGNKDRGAAYVFKRNAGSWQFLQKIVPSDISQGVPGNSFGDYFGYSISRDNNNLLIGATFEDFSPTVNDRGAVYLYEWVGNEFVFRKQFIVNDAQNQELFGYSSSILGDDLMVGAIGRDSFTGAVYFIRKD